MVVIFVPIVIIIVTVVIIIVTVVVFMIIEVIVTVVVIVTIVVVTVPMVVVILFVAVLVPMAAVVFAITVVLSPKVTVVKVTSPVTMPVAITVLLVSLPVVVAGFGVLVSQPQVRIELVVKLVVVGLVRIELVQVLAGLLAEADDRRTVRAVGELASSRCRVVLDVESEVLLSPLGQKSCHQVVEALGVVHADTEVFFLFVVLVLLAPTLLILLAPPIALVRLVEILQVIRLLVLEPVALLGLLAALLLPGAEAGVGTALKLGQVKVPEAGAAAMSLVWIVEDQVRVMIFLFNL